MRKKMGTAHLCTRASHVRTKHDRPRSLVIELLAGGLETVLEELNVATTAVAALLVLDLVLNDERLVVELDRLSEGSGDGMVGSLVLGDESLVTLDRGLEGILYLPLANIAEGLCADWSLLGRFRHSPSFTPVVGELFEEGSLDGRGLE